MSGWLTNARAAVTGGAGAVDVELFERPCLCGETLAGERLTQAQEVACPGCGREWFILPRDPYPRPRRRVTAPSLLRRLRKAGSSGSVPVVSESKDRPSSATTATKKAALPKQPPVRERLRAARRSLRESLRRAARPLRLVIAGIGIAFIVTGAWLWHRSRVDAASATLVAAVPQAEEALREHDFPTAERLLADAVAAVDLLGANDTTAAQVRQRYRETFAANNLAAQTPYDLAAEAEAMAANPAEWSERFRASIAGRWVILDVPLGPPEEPFRVQTATDDEEAEPKPAPPPEKVHRLDLPLVAGEHSVQFEIGTDLFRPLPSPTRAIFAAQYDSWELEPAGKDTDVWIVRFKPRTAFLWASGDIYTALGFDLDDPAAPPRVVLATQAETLGLSRLNSKEQKPD